MRRWKSLLQNLGNKNSKSKRGSSFWPVKPGIHHIPFFADLWSFEPSNFLWSFPPNLPWLCCHKPSLTGKHPPGTRMVGLRVAGNCRNFLPKYCCVFRKSGVGRVHPRKRTSIWRCTASPITTSDFLLPCLFSGGGGYSSCHNNGSGNEAAEDGFSVQTWPFASIFHLGVSKKRGTTKWMIYNGKPY